MRTLSTLFNDLSVAIQVLAVSRIAIGLVLNKNSYTEGNIRRTSLMSASIAFLIAHNRARYLGHMKIRTKSTSGFRPPPTLLPCLELLLVFSFSKVRKKHSLPQLQKKAQKARRKKNKKTQMKDFLP